VIRRRLLAALAALVPATLPAQVGERLIVLNKAEANASLIDLHSGMVVATLPVGDGPHEVAVRDDGALAVACNYGTGPAPGSSLTVLDLQQVAVVRTIALGNYRRPHGIAWLPDRRHVVVTVEANQAVLLVDVEQGRVVQAIPTDQQGTHLLVRSRDGTRLYTSNIGSGSVSLIDLVKRERVKTTVTGKFPEAIDLSPDGTRLWSADRTLERVTILDAATLDTLRSLPTGKFPNRLKFTPDGGTVVLSNAQSSTLGFYDVAQSRPDGELTFTVDPALVRPSVLGNQMGNSAVPLGILMHPSGTRAFVALAAYDRIAEVDLRARRVLRLLEAGREPDGMALVPARK
jgi:DNA-binding beta-propeller fold protein YncE